MNPGGSADACYGPYACYACRRSDADELEAEKLGTFLGVAQQRAEQQIERRAERAHEQDLDQNVPPTAANRHSCHREEHRPERRHEQVARVEVAHDGDHDQPNDVGAGQRLRPSEPGHTLGDRPAALQLGPTGSTSYEYNAYACPSHPTCGPLASLRAGADGVPFLLDWRQRSATTTRGWREGSGLAARAPVSRGISVKLGVSWGVRHA